MYSALTNTFYESKEVYLGYGEAAAGIGLMVGPIIGGYLYSTYNYFVCYIAMAVFICIDIVFTIIVMPGDSRKSKKAGTATEVQNLDESEDEKQAREDEEKRLDTLSKQTETQVPYSWFLLNRRSIFGLITVGMTMVLVSFKAAFMTTYLKDKKNIGEEYHGWIVGIPSMFYVISCNIVGRIVDKAPRRIFIVVSFLAMTASGFMLGPSRLLGMPDDVTLLLIATCCNAVS
jgi:MFS family permease